jgi:hypothetical protein
MGPARQTFFRSPRAAKGTRHCAFRSGAWEENRTPDLRITVRKWTGNDEWHPEIIGRHPSSSPLEGKPPESGGSRVAGQDRVIRKSVATRQVPTALEAAIATEAWIGAILRLQNIQRTHGVGDRGTNRSTTVVSPTRWRPAPSQGRAVRKPPLAAESTGSQNVVRWFVQGNTGSVVLVVGECATGRREERGGIGNGTYGETNRSCRSRSVSAVMGAEPMVVGTEGER